ncbi:MAG: hypothetical protein ACXVBE_02420 [Bdellovibrionota bacterium]
MARTLYLLILAFLLLGGISHFPAAYAGEEDVKQEKAKQAPVEPETVAAPTQPDAPDLSVGEEPSPVFDAKPESAPSSPVQKGKQARAPWDPDANIDYSDLLGRVEADEPGRGVLPPALGFRGYMPNMVAASAGDRTPGVGALLEYSWNRLGFGAYYSYRNLHDADLYSYSQSFIGAYGLYRWLPFEISPLILIGLETSSKALESFGGTAGFGIDARIYSGWTALVGYTYHSTVHRGFIGGGLGWSF